MPNTRPLKVFLCHATADKSGVHKLYRYLKQRGIDPWLDEIDLLPGENWETVIPEALFDSDVILVCLSKNSVSKEGFVQKEIAFALDKALEKPEGMIYVIPAKLEECDIPQRLKRFQWVNLYREDGRKRLMLSLNKRARQVGSLTEQVVMSEGPSEKIVVTVDEKIVLEKEELEAKEKAVPAFIEELASYGIEDEIVEKVVYEEKDLKNTTTTVTHESEENKFAEKIVHEKIKRKTEKEETYTTLQELVSQSNSSTRSQINKLSSSSLKILSIGLLAVVTFFVVLWGVYQLRSDVFSVNSKESFIATTTSTRMPPSSALLTTTLPPSLPIATSILAQPLNNDSIVIGKDGAVLVYVPDGEFLMGSTDKDLLAESDEKPQHLVDLAAFWIDQTEVTNKLFSSFVSATEYRTDAEKVGWSYVNNGQKWLKVSGANWQNPTGPSSNILDKEQHPVMQVSWNDAIAYCKWVGRRLPTEAEWEKAARGTGGNVYPWGNDMPNDDLLNYRLSVGDTTRVGFYLNGISPYNVLDMAGNVWEWTSSVYKPYPYNALDGREDLSQKVRRVVRGGSYYEDFNGVRSSDRYWLDSDSHYIHVGFRCAMDATP